MDVSDRAWLAGCSFASFAHLLHPQNTRAHPPWPPTVLGTVLSSHLRRRADAVPAAIFYQTAITAYQLCPASTLPAYSFTDYTTQALLYQRQPQLKQQRSYPCIFILSILYTCLSFVPALNSRFAAKPQRTFCKKICLLCVRFRPLFVCISSMSASMRASSRNHNHTRTALQGRSPAPPLLLPRPAHYPQK